jgi:SAM-dependent methyltransferase
MSFANALHRKVHATQVFSRRAEKLTRALDKLLPAAATILDVGCGNGVISWKLRQMSPGRQFTGIDVVERDTCMIPCSMYDGDTIPFAPASFDYVLFVDVLHHTPDSEKLLAQAARIARRGIVIKDHYCESVLDYRTLALMDWFGNAQYGIALPNDYKSTRQWRELFGRLGLREIRTETEIGLYPFPFNAIFGRRLHFVSLHEVSRSPGGALPA